MNLNCRRWRGRCGRSRSASERRTAQPHARGDPRAASRHPADARSLSRHRRTWREGWRRRLRAVRGWLSRRAVPAGNAGLAGEIVIEDLGNLAVDVEYASEYLYRTAHSMLAPALMVICAVRRNCRHARRIKARGCQTWRAGHVRRSPTSGCFHDDARSTISLQTCAGHEAGNPCNQELHEPASGAPAFRLWRSSEIRGSSAEPGARCQCLAAGA